MATALKTTVNLDRDNVAALREMSRSQSRSQAELIQEANRRFARRVKRTAMQGIGAFRSGRSDISEKAEELLAEGARRQFE